MLRITYKRWEADIIDMREFKTYKEAVDWLAEQVKLEPTSIEHIEGEEES